MNFLDKALRGQTLAGKLNLVIVGLLVAVFGTGNLWLSSRLSKRLEESGSASLVAANQRVIGMIDAYAGALERSAGMLGAAFAQQAGASLEASESTVETHQRLVDTFSRATLGVATLFIRQGEDFVRSATTLKNSEGMRAVGTLLDRKHPAYAALLAGQSYTGRALLFGRDYMTHYVPLKDAGGQTTGIAFVGIDFTESLAALKKQIREIRIGDSGYAYILEAGAQPGLVVVHPSLEGKSMFDARASDGRQFVQEMVAAKSGLIRYSSSDSAHQSSPRDKLAAYDTFPRWNWLVVSSGFRDELTRDARFVSAALGIACVLITILIGLCVSLMIRRMLSRPLQEAVEAFKRMAQGDLRVRMKARSEDEIGQMMQACGQMCDALREMVGKTQQGMHVILQEAGHLQQVADNVAIGSQEQSDGAAALAASIEELSVGIEQMAGHSQDTHRIVEVSHRISAQGSAVIAEAVTAMNEIARTVHVSSQVTAQLGAKTEEIAKVVTVIREIAEQTNLLALNAAIEAARAGEQGRGFAVVADEVRKLAERTRLSTQEIATTIANITAGGQEVATNMNRGVAQVMAGVDLANKAGSCITEMHAGSSRVDHAVLSIADSLREQSSASEHIAGTVEEIAHQAENNLEQARGAADSSRRMHEIAQRTREMLGWFKL